MSALDNHEDDVHTDPPVAGQSDAPVEVGPHDPDHSLPRNSLGEELGRFPPAAAPTHYPEYNVGS